ncbi:MAG TPA: R3H domain-containing nucleic acid-binding protein [Candidatus Eisenbacteria bacterium]|nr:R3H domain-containing nucleic acid-binding protein [Candidatus Eisenbacteria bacterium]
MAEGGVESEQTVLPDAPVERVRIVLERIVEELGLEASVAVTDGEDEIHADIEGEEVGLLIGRHGQTIDAVQLLCYQAAFRGRHDRKRVSVDAAGYRRRQAESLRRRADMAAEDALQHRQAVEMDPMGSNERRVVHEHLRDRPEIETYSEGDEPSRYVVVAPLLSD